MPKPDYSVAAAVAAAVVVVLQLFGAHVPPQTVTLVVAVGPTTYLVAATAAVTKAAVGYYTSCLEA